MKKRIKFVILLVLLLLAGAAYWYLLAGGVTHRELKETVLSESEQVQMKLDARCDVLEAKLDRIEAKLDRLIDLATPRLPDAMRPASVDR